MKNIILFFIITLEISCVSNPKIFTIDDKLMDDKGKQILFLTNKPNYEYKEVAIVSLSLTSKKNKWESLVYEKLKMSLIENKYDAIIDIKSNMVLKSFGMAAINYSGVGIVKIK